MEPLTIEQRAAHLDRIGLVDAGAPIPSEPGPGDVTLVADLQLAHLLAVPFENLEIHLGRPIVLDPGRIHAKVVDRRRGGYCYELNSQFARLLAAFGFEPTLVSARVARPDGSFGERFDHMALLVPCRTGTGTGPDDGEVVEHLVDVGFGDGATRPVPLADPSVVEGVPVDDRDRRLRARPAPGGGGDWFYEEDRGEGWVVRYRFERVAQDLAAFADRNRWQQSSPDSHFTAQLVASRLTDEGRATLTGPVPGAEGETRLIVTGLDGDRTERTVEPADVREVLRTELGLELPGSGPALVPSIDEIPAEILANPVATLATNGPDGRPQLTAVWFGVEDGAICVSATADTQKARNLRRDRRCTVLAYHPEMTTWYAEIRGVAILEDDRGYRFADRLGPSRYSIDFRSFDGPDAHRLRLVIRPTRIVVTDARG